MMLVAALGFFDFWVIGLLIFFVGAGVVASVLRGSAVPERLQRVERKLDLIMTHLGIDYVPPPIPTWQELAVDPAQRIAAIKLYRQQHKVGLVEAKNAVDDYLETHRV
jgi:hypothetical protein